MEFVTKFFSAVSLLYLCVGVEAFSPTIACHENHKIRSGRNSAHVKIPIVNLSEEQYPGAPLYATKQQTCEDVIETGIKKESEDRRIVVECVESIESNSSSDESIDNHEYDGENEVQSDEEAELQRRRRAAMAARLLKKGTVPTRSRSGSVRDSKVKRASARETSVGTRREGSATRARSRTSGARGGGLSGQIMKGIRSTAAAAAAAKKKGARDGGSGNGTTSKECSSGSTMNKNVIQSTIDVLIEAQKEVRNIEIQSYGPVNEQKGNEHFEIFTRPEPGTILVERTKSKSTYSCTRERIKDNTIVRVATEKDDLNIAKLRLSVFSDFSPEIRRQFRSRSCEVLGNRRQKGATCIVASVDYRDAGNEFECKNDSAAHNWVIGSLECSTHEYAGTKLGMRRPSGSIMYITEVAVSPRARRTGAGTKLLQGIDELAKVRGVETVYLHVDVTNVAACALYEKAGYEILDPMDPVYSDFTTQLNLHDGATKGRNHHFLQKKITKKQTWLDYKEPEEKDRGVLGFEVLDIV